MRIFKMRIFSNITRKMAAAAVAAILLIPASASAQTHYHSNVALGGKAGVTMSRIFFNPGVEQKMPMGITFGGMFRYIEEDHFGLIAEVNFLQRGWEENFEDAPYRYKRLLSYVQIPVLAHIYFGRRGRFFFNAGPEFGIYLGSKTSANFDPAQMASLPDFPNVNRMNTQMTLDVQNKFDYGISAGLGAEFNINRRNSLCLEARFYYGLGNIFKSARTDPFKASNSMTIMATLGYWFRVK